MTDADILALIPEDKREVVKGELAGRVKIDSREIAAKVLMENQAIKAEFDAAVSKAVAVHDEKFKAEKLAGIVDEEIKKRAPKPKDPELAAALERVEKLEKQTKDAENAAARERQKARALGKIGELKFPPQLADKFAGLTDEETDGNLKFLAETLGPWVQEVEKGAKLGIINRGTPGSAEAPKATDLQAQLEKAFADGNADLALKLQGMIQAQGRPRA